MDVDPSDEERRIVHQPWYNKAEFDEVAMQAYSDDYNLKRAAYNKMCVWKTRCNINQKLPFGVNSTMMILEAQLKDSEAQLNDRESIEGQQFLSVAQDVQQYYLNGILWYLSNVRAAYGSSYSSVGYCMNINDWVLSLATTDGLIPLNLLRTAAELVLKWLSEIFWEPQEFIMEDYVLKDTENQDIELLNMAYFFKIWSSARVYEMAGMERINQVPNEELRLELLTLLTFWYDNDNCEFNSHSYSDPELHKLKDIMQRLLYEIAHYLQTATLVVKKAVIYKLLENRGFLSADVFLEEESPVTVMEEVIISSLASLWYEVLKMIDTQHLTFFLLEALVKIAQSNESVHRSRMAALWVAQLTKMVNQTHMVNVYEAGLKCFDVTESLDIEYKKLGSTLENNLCGGVFQILLDHLSAAIDAHLPILPLQPFKGLSRCYAGNLGKEIVRDPNKFTPYILPGLLDCCGEHLPMNIKEDLLSKVGIHPKESNEESSDMEVEDEDEVEIDEEEEEEDEDEEEEVEVELEEEVDDDEEEEEEEEEEESSDSDSLEAVFSELDSIMAELEWCCCYHSVELENGEASTSTVNAVESSMSTVNAVESSMSTVNAVVASTSTVNGVEASSSTENGVEANTSTANGVPYSGTED